jgi:hypothetical protein
MSAKYQKQTLWVTKLWYPASSMTIDSSSMRLRPQCDRIQTMSVFVRNTAVAAVCLFAISIVATSTTVAETLDVLGQFGVLGEWEMTGNISSTDGARKQFSGPFVMKHIGFCSVDGPELKQGEIRLQLIGSSRVKATLLVAGVTCTYAGRKSDSFNGVLRCPDQRDVPLQMWLK